MKHFGDITKLNGTELPIVDIITGGSPCQDLSVAGKRAGLAGERSGLFMDQIRIIKEMRNESRKRNTATRADEFIRPRYMVWENVPGAFSSNKGEDFRAVLEETARVVQRDAVIPRLETGKDGKQKWSKSGAIMGDGWSIAWRVHDAQFWGVPQRRKRIALVADFGGESAPEILFERKGLSGDIVQSGKEGERVAEDTERCAGETSTEQIVALTTEITPKIDDDGVAFSLRSRDYKDPQSVCCFEPGAMSRVGGHAYEDVAGTVRANAGDNQQAVVYGISAYESNAMKSGNPNSGIYEAETARTLDLNGGNPGCNQGGMAVVHCVDQGGGKSQCGVSEDVSPTLATTHGGEPVICLEGNGQRNGHRENGFVESDTMYTLNTVEQHAVCIENHPADSRVKISENGICQTLSGRMGTGGGNVPMVMESQTFSDVASTRSAADGTKGVHSKMMKNPGKNFVLEPVAMASKQISQNIGENIGMTLCGNDYKEPQCVAYGLDRENIGAVDCRNGIENENVNGILQAKEQGQNLNSNNVVRINSVVRRLTPLEAERLQNFPDHWTDIGDWIDSKGKLHKGESDSPRYKALGNSIALPFWQYLAEKMVKYIDHPTMASLFDGIGGFPLVYSRCGCKPVWASEIEEFPIAVSKKHFPDNEYTVAISYLESMGL